MKRTKVIISHEDGCKSEWSTVRAGTLKYEPSEDTYIRLDKSGRRHRFGNRWTIYMCNGPRCKGRIALNDYALWDFINDKE